MPHETLSITIFMTDTHKHRSTKGT